jgi:Zn finger protein HypA/HybF involved in hydrogenase expression
MHELSLMEELRRQSLAAAAAAGAVSIVAIRLRLGELAGVELDALRFAFPLVMRDTIGAQAQNCRSNRSRQSVTANRAARPFTPSKGSETAPAAAPSATGCSAARRCSWWGWK